MCWLLWLFPGVRNDYFQVLETTLSSEVWCRFPRSSSKYRVKSVRIRSFLVLYFPAFGLNTNQKNFKCGQFSRNEVFKAYTLIKYLSLFKTVTFFVPICWKKIIKAMILLIFKVWLYRWIFNFSIIWFNNDYVKSVFIRSFSGPFFPIFGPEKLRIQTLFFLWSPILGFILTVSICCFWNCLFLHTFSVSNNYNLYTRLLSSHN